MLKSWGWWNYRLFILQTGKYRRQNVPVFKECVDSSGLIPRILEDIKIVPALYYTNLAINTVGVRKRAKGT